MTADIQTAGNFEACLLITLRWEGGYSDDAADPGGATMHGITHAEYDLWRHKRGLEPRDVRLLTKVELEAIYHENYWLPCGCDGLAAGLDLCVFDGAVNSGVSRALAWLKQADQDIDKFCDLRLAFLKRTGRLWTVFGRGWSRRVAGIRRQAHKMAAPAPVEEKLSLLQLLLSLIPQIIGQVMTTPQTSTPISLPMSTKDVTLSPVTNLATHVVTALGAALATFGVNSGSVATAAGGIGVSVLSWLFSRIFVNSSNNKTVQLIDAILTSVMGQAQPAAQPQKAS